NQKDYSGSWTSISLRSATGNATDIYAHSSGCFSDTDLLKKCGYFGKVLNQIKCEKESVRLLCLAPGSEIKEHTDRELGYGFGNFRLHIPIKTDENVQFRVGGEDIRMNAGECWYANFHLPHSVQHNGTENRIHLVIDCLRNAWTDDWFAKAGYDFEEERKSKIPNPETVKRMMEELAHLNTEVALQLKQQLQKDLTSF
ncbi:MAG: aspartyl/asparaginyl beta-hydroxylase domain-containing protein, partial [Chitinophagaceae bacterium]